MLPQLFLYLTLIVVAVTGVTVGATGLIRRSTLLLLLAALLVSTVGGFAFSALALS